MPTPAIRVENLGKRYRLGATHSQTLGALLSSSTARLFGRRNGHAPAPKLLGNGPSQMDEDDNFWALKDVSFDVQPGEVVGIIGRNGAGKSTLLKILSNIVSPTTGHVELHGRVASLLEVGTGFHPELTGRENVYLNGAILGMTKAEIKRQYDEIVEFAEITQFIDTPVKRYSSGMYVRLAFSVAAHLLWDILIVDEVLGVGDAAFQSKCLQMMHRASSSGRTIFFVSHQLHQVARLTRTAILLENGRLVEQGPTQAVLQRYLQTSGETTPEWKPQEQNRSGVVTLEAIRVTRSSGDLAYNVTCDELIQVAIEYDVRSRIDLQIAFRLNSDVDGSTIFTTAAPDQRHQKTDSHDPGGYIATTVIPAHLLKPGSYHLLVAANLSNGLSADLQERAVSFTVSSINSLINIDGRWGEIAPLLEWKCERNA